MTTTEKQLSPNEIQFTQAVKALLAEKHTHHDLKLRLHQLVMEEAKGLPPIKVLLCGSYGGYGLSESFTTFVRSHTEMADTDTHRSDPALIQAVSDYGRFICDKFPFILNDMRCLSTWKLDKLLDNLKRLPVKEMEFQPDLVAEATSFVKQNFGSFPEEERTTDLEVFTGKQPDFWMAHHALGDYQRALRFAHVLLQGGNHTRYRVEPDGAQDAAIYERIGLAGASTKYSNLYIREIPALVDFHINVYDGLESVRYSVVGGMGVDEDVEFQWSGF